MIRLLRTDGAALAALAVAWIAATRPGVPHEAVEAARLGSIIVGVLLVFPAVDPWKRLRWDEKPLPRARLVTAVLAAVGALVLAGRPPAEAQGVFAFGLVLLVAAMGNLFPAIRRNAYFGIRTPWTLRDDRVWERTHRVFGHLCVGGAAVLAALWPLLSAHAFQAALGASAAALAVGAIAYSWLLSRRLPPLA